MLVRGGLYGESTFRESSRMEHSLLARTECLVCKAGHDEVKEHHFFDLFNWDAILGMTTQPLYTAVADGGLRQFARPARAVPFWPGGVTSDGWRCWCWCSCCS
mmetsp:Transcript_174656/g.560082  ORF Transcript_174656/g.560082 Transcript_174656/m.560082 type:complete len:103 (+) Transcript_174656:251-559(+)